MTAGYCVIIFLSWRSALEKLWINYYLKEVSEQEGKRMAKQDNWKRKWNVWNDETFIVQCNLLMISLRCWFFPVFFSPPASLSSHASAFSWSCLNLLITIRSYPLHLLNLNKYFLTLILGCCRWWTEEKN